MITLTSTVDDAKRWLRKQLREGARCPVCDRHTQLYRRQITSTSARDLILMAQSSGRGEPFHLMTVIEGRHADETKLAYWGLIEEEAQVRPDGGRAGWWTVTDAGREFARGALTVPKYALVYNGRCLGLEGDEVGIRECLGKRFDLAELLAGG